MAEIGLRIAKGQAQGKFKGEGDVYIVPLDIIPYDIPSGDLVKFVIEGIINVNDSDATIDAKRVHVERVRKTRSDEFQDGVEKDMQELAQQ